MYVCMHVSRVVVVAVVVEVLFCLVAALVVALIVQVAALVAILAAAQPLSLSLSLLKMCPILVPQPSTPAVLPQKDPVWCALWHPCFGSVPRERSRHPEVWT